MYYVIEDNLPLPEYAFLYDTDVKGPFSRRGDADEAAEKYALTHRKAALVVEVLGRYDPSTTSKRFK